MATIAAESPAQPSSITANDSSIPAPHDNTDPSLPPPPNVTSDIKLHTEALSHSENHSYESQPHPNGTHYDPPPHHDGSTYPHGSPYDPSLPRAPPNQRSPTPSPPPSDYDHEAEVDTRKHMEAPRNSHGKMICLRPGCESMTFDRKCEWAKHMDKHDRPYRCTDPMCRKLKGFTYSGGLLRHQREVHKAHGGPKDQLVCPIPYCKRNGGPGFTRKENLNEHIRRVHRQVVPKEDDPAPGGRRERRGGKRRRTEEVLPASGEEVPVDSALMGGQQGQAPEAQMMEGHAPPGDDEQHPNGEAQRLHAEAEQAPMTAEAVQLAAESQARSQEQGHQQGHGGGQNVVNHAIAPEFQVASMMSSTADYELAYLRHEVEKLRQENEEKDERIRRLEESLRGGR